MSCSSTLVWWLFNSAHNGWRVFFDKCHFHSYSYFLSLTTCFIFSQSGPGTGRKKGKFHHRSRRSPTPPETTVNTHRETLTYAEAQRLVEVDINGKLRRINIFEPLKIVTKVWVWLFLDSKGYTCNSCQKLFILIIHTDKTPSTHNYNKVGTCIDQWVSLLKHWLICFDYIY